MASSSTNNTTEVQATAGASGISNSSDANRTTPEAGEATAPPQAGSPQASLAVPLRPPASSALGIIKHMPPLAAVGVLSFVMAALF